MILEAPHKDLHILKDQQNAISTTIFAENYPLNILVAEDNTINQKLAQRILQKLGFKPDIVSDGIQAVEAVKKKDYSVILMDVRMPEMDGFEATHTIRQMLIEQPYIIAMTANTMSQDKEECLQIGMNDYVAKPMRLEEITKILKEASDYFTVTKIKC